MTNLKIDRKIGKDNNLNITNISFTPEKENPIDNAIYYLICAQEKLKAENNIENLLAESRIELAITTLRKFLVQLDDFKIKEPNENN